MFVGGLNIQCAEEPPRYRYTVSWDFWDNREDLQNGWGNMEIRLNGVPLGNRKVGFEKLEKLEVEHGEHMRIEMPPMPRTVHCRPGHWASGFLQRWLEKGALVDWYEGGKQFKLHTVAWTDYIKDGNYVRSMDEVTWTVDGNIVGKRENFLSLIESWKKESALVIQILYPLKWDPPSEVDPGETLGNLITLRDKEKMRIRVFRIIP